MSGAIVAIAQVIQWPVAFAALWLSWATLTAAEAIGPRWPRTGLALVDISGWCSSVARRMLQGGGHERPSVPTP